MMPVFVRAIVKLMVVVAVFTGINVHTAAQAASLISTSEEISIGRDVAKELEKQYGVVDDPALEERVAKIGARLVAVSDRRDLTYTFKVLNSKEINAMALPGGFVYVFKGLVDYMPSDDELAGVIGHEVGHVVKRHTVKQMEKSMVMSVLFGAVFGDRGAFLQNLAYNAIMSGYSRDDEREADRLGFVYSFKAGYNPYSMIIGLSKLAEIDNGSYNRLFSDHPEAKSRVALVNGYLHNAKITPEVVDNGTSAQVVDGAWSLPPLTVTAGGYKPLYRAYFLAGRIYQVGQLSDFSADKFILYANDDGTITIMYDDRNLITLTAEDGAAQNMTPTELGELYITKLREWAQKHQSAASAVTTAKETNN